MPSRGNARRSRTSQWPEAADLVAWSQRRGRPGFAPEFPVCRSRERSRGRPPESKAKCRGRAKPVKQIASSILRPQSFPRSGTTGGKPCRLGMTLTRDLDGPAALRRRPRRSGARRNLTAMRKGKWRRTKNLGAVQERRSWPPIAPVSPGASLCPSGNQGATATCHESSHGMARQACRGKVRGSLLGVT